MKNVNDIITSLKTQYNIDISEFVIQSKKRNILTFSVDKLSSNTISDIERFANSRKLRIEPNGYKKYCIILK